MYTMLMNKRQDNPSHLAEVVADGVVNGDLDCLNCGYNLRTLHASQGCPECGMSIAVTLRKDLLRESSPAWLMTVQRGTRLLRLGVFLSFPLLYIGVVLGVIGLFHVLQKEVGRDEPAKDRNVRLAAQGLLGISAMGFVAVIMSVGWMLMIQRSRVFEQVTYFDSFYIAVHVAFVAGVVMSWRYLKILAERIPEANLIKRCNRMVWEWIGMVIGIVAIAALANVGNVLYTFFGQYHWLYAPGLFVVVCLGLIWLWWRTLRFCGTIIHHLNVVIAGREQDVERS